MILSMFFDIIDLDRLFDFPLFSILLSRLLSSISVLNNFINVFRSILIDYLTSIFSILIDYRQSYRLFQF